MVSFTSLVFEALLGLHKVSFQWDCDQSSSSTCIPQSFAPKLKLLRAYQIFELFLDFTRFRLEAQNYGELDLLGFHKVSLIISNYWDRAFELYLQSLLRSIQSLNYWAWPLFKCKVARCKVKYQELMVLTKENSWQLEFPILLRPQVETFNLRKFGLICGFNKLIQNSTFLAKPIFNRSGVWAIVKWSCSKCDIERGTSLYKWHSWHACNWTYKITLSIPKRPHPWCNFEIWRRAWSRHSTWDPSKSSLSNKLSTSLV